MRSVSRNSLESFSSRCHSRSCRSQTKALVGGIDAAPAFLVFPVGGDPLFRHAVHLPVRIWISIGSPVGPMTVVWRDW